MKPRAPLAVAGAVVAVTCVALGIWQLARLAERRDVNRRLIARAAMPALDALPDPSGGRDDPAAYRRIYIAGTYDPSNEVILRARSLDGRAGNHVLTPLRTSGGRAIVVDRGWVPLALNEPPVTEAAPPGGEVVVTGILVPSEPKPRFFGPRDPAEGRLATIGRLDVERLASQFPYPIEPLALAAEEQQPPQAGELPVAAGRPPPGEGPHLAYAVQWFVFAALASLTTVLLIRAERRQRAQPSTSAETRL